MDGKNSQKKRDDIRERPFESVLLNIVLAFSAVLSLITVFAFADINSEEPSLGDDEKEQVVAAFDDRGILLDESYVSFEGIDDTSAYVVLDGYPISAKGIAVPLTRDLVFEVRALSGYTIEFVEIAEGNQTSNPIPFETDGNTYIIRAKELAKTHFMVVSARTIATFQEPEGEGTESENAAAGIEEENESIHSSSAVPLSLISQLLDKESGYCP